MHVCTVAPLWQGPRLMYQGSLVLIGVCRLWQIQVHAWRDDIQRTMASLRDKPKRSHDLCHNVLPTAFTLPDTETTDSIMYEPCPALKRHTQTTVPWVHDVWSEAPDVPWQMSPQEPLAPLDLGLTDIAFPISPKDSSFTELPHRHIIASTSTPLPTVMRTGPAPNRAAPKRKCLSDQKVGFDEEEWERRCEAARRASCTRQWYSAWDRAWPKCTIKRLCLCTSHALETLWDTTVGTHLHVLERHYQNERNMCRNQWAQQQWEADVPAIEDEYTQEVGRGETVVDEVFPWTNMGEWRWDVPEDDLGHDDSISSANTSIVQQAARWISPNVSSDSLERPRLSRAHDASLMTPLLTSKEVSTASMDTDTHDFYMYMQVVRQSVPERAYIPFPEVIPPNHVGPHVPVHACMYASLTQSGTRWFWHRRALVVSSNSSRMQKFTFTCNKKLARTGFEPANGGWLMWVKNHPA